MTVFDEALYLHDKCSSLRVVPGRNQGGFRVRTNFILLLITLTLSACGGGGGVTTTDDTSPDITPDTFSFSDQIDVALSSVISSNSITVAGINTAAAISVTGGEYAIDGAAFTSTEGTVSNGQSIVVRQTSSASFATLTDAILTIGGITDTFSVTTLVADTAPDAFSFTDQIDVILSTVITSNSITVTGIEAAAAISVSDGEYSIDGAAFTSSAGTVSNGQTVTVRHTSSSLFTTLTSTLLSIGGISDLFSSTTGPIGTGFNQARGFNSSVASLSAAADGSGDVYVGGGFSIYNSTASNGIIRLNPDSSVDTAFAVGSGFNSTVLSLSPATDGSGDVYVGGDFTTYDGIASTRIIRLNSDGTVDSAFAVGSGFDNRVQILSPATDGSGDVYVGGFFSNYDGIASAKIIRLNSDGAVDSAFAVGSGINGFVSSLSPAADGSGDLYVGGNFTTYNGTASNNIIRLNSDGTVDTAFVVGSGFDEVVLSLSPATDGSGDVYVGGFFTTYNGIASNRIVRLNSNGTVDSAFAVGTGFDAGVSIISSATDGSGDVYVGGFFTTYDGTASNRIIRLNSNGTVDSAFAVGTGFDDGVSIISSAVDGSGDVYLGGFFSTYNGTASNRIIRLNSDGTVDTAFNVGSGFDNFVSTLSSATDGSGDVYVGGGFSSYNGSASNRIIRLNSDGTVDTAFAVDSGFDSSVQSLSPAADGSGDVFVGGQFRVYQTTVVDRIVRLNPDGSLN